MTENIKIMAMAVFMGISIKLSIQIEKDSRFCIG